MKGLYNQIVLGIIAVSLSVLAIMNLDIVGSANAVVNTYPAVAKSGEPMIGEIKLFAGDFAPEGWAICDGSQLDIDDYGDLYTIIGDVYGGESRKTFALPDLRGRTAVGLGYNDNIGEVELASSRVFNSDLLRVPTRLPQEKPNATITKKDRAKTNTFQSVTNKVRTGDLGLNYIICVDGVMPE